MAIQTSRPKEQSTPRIASSVSDPGLQNPCIGRPGTYGICLQVSRIRSKALVQTAAIGILARRLARKGAAGNVAQP
jgi:hypothetical protein